MILGLNQPPHAVVGEININSSGLTPGFARFVPISTFKQELPNQIHNVVELMQTFCTGDYLYTYVDFHVTQMPSRRTHWHNWHIDFSTGGDNIDDGRHIITSTIIGTEFVDGPVVLFDKRQNVQGIVTLPPTTLVSQVQANSIAVYHGGSIHRVPSSTLDPKSSGIRVVIRVSETNRQYDMVKHDEYKRSI